MTIQNYTDRLATHWNEYFGIKGNALAWNQGPIEKLDPEFKILEFQPNKKHNMWAYCTVGMSVGREDDNLIELFIYSPRQDNALVELLTLCAFYHATIQTVELNDTINFGKSWLDNSICNYGFISLPYLDGEQLELFKYNNNTSHCYWLIPISEQERDFKSNLGTEALEEIFESNQFDYLNPEKKISGIAKAPSANSASGLMHYMSARLKMNHSKFNHKIKMRKQLQKSIPIALLVFLGLINFAKSQSISAGGDHSVFLCPNNSPMVCGYNLSGQLGDNTTTYRYTPVQINSISNLIAISAGNDHTLFLKNDGTVWACGNNYYGQLGNGTQSNNYVPTQIPTLSNIIAIAAGQYFSLFLKSDGSVWACGYNSDGNLGDGTTVKKLTPIQTSITGIKAIAAGGGLGGSHSIFLKTDGTVWTCGYNSYGQIGDGTSSSLSGKKNPVQVTGLTGITAIAAGGYHSVFLKNDGTVWACGWNSQGQLGDGTTTDRKFAVQVSSVSTISSIAAGEYHSLYLKNTGEVWACGYNGAGQLADGTTINKKTPFQVNVLSNINAIAAGDDHSLFKKNDGSVWACGESDYGRLGVGTTTDKYSPIQVTNLCSITGIEENSSEDNISLYPNPANEQLFIELTDYKNKSAEVFNSQGDLLQSISLQSNTTAIQLNTFPNGIYFIKVSSPEGMVMKKIVKN